MKNSIGKYFIGGGIVLIISEIFFKILNYPDTFKGQISGPILIFIGFIFLNFKGSEQNPNLVNITSRLSFFLKYFLSIFIISLNLFFFIGTFFLFPKEELIYFLLLDTFLIIISLFFLRITLALKSIKYDSTSFIVENFINLKSHRIEFDEIDQIKPVFLIFYKLKTRNNINYFFVSRITDFFTNMYSTPASILKIKEKINQYKKNN